METPLSFAGNPLDRASAERPGEAWIAARRAVGRFLPFWQMKLLVKHGRAAFLPWDRAWEGCTTVFLGLDGGASAPAGATKNDVPLFAVDLGAAEPAPALPSGLEKAEFHDMRAAATLLPGRDTAIAGQARALLDWHARHGFCPNCGHATQSKDGGYRRLCPHCGAEHFPRTDPVVIMLPTFGDECLVGRNARFVNGLFSAFAGFIEPGESLEEAVRRELKEEVAVRIGAVRYHRSQPWPFPSSLMLGCYAEALSKDFAIDGTEIAEARWITKDQARRWLKDEVMDAMRIPAIIAIAHHLVRDWVEG